VIGKVATKRVLAVLGELYFKEILVKLFVESRIFANETGDDYRHFFDRETKL
jgi:hypothetical protein